MPYRLTVAMILLAGSAAAIFTTFDKSDARAPRPAAIVTAASRPVVIELYQSQGCSSCPPANADLNAIAARDNVLALSFAVTYWDRLGWKDTFGSPRYTARQQDYAHAGKVEVATPEFIIDGTFAVLGSNRPAIEAAIIKARAVAAGPAISKTSTGIRVDEAATASPAAVWLVRYDPQTREVPIRAGENGGRTLPHRNIVRELVRLGDWDGHASSFALPPAHEGGLMTAVLVQSGRGGAIVSARKL